MSCATTSIPRNSIPWPTPPLWAWPETLNIDSTPTILVNGQRVELGADDLDSPGAVLAALDRAEVSPIPGMLNINVETGPDGRRTIVATWPENLQDRVDHGDIYWVESAVMLNSANACWLQGSVVRGHGDANAMQWSPGRLDATLDIAGVRTSHKTFAQQVETEYGITYRSIPSYVDVRQSHAVVKLYDKAGNLVAAGTAAL